MCQKTGDYLAKTPFFEIASTVARELSLGRREYQLNGESPMSFAALSIGERIVLVARMAAEAHHHLREGESEVGRRPAGEAGMRVTDDSVPPNVRRAQTSAPLAEGEGQ
jgi:hypothetical protein